MRFWLYQIILIILFPLLLAITIQQMIRRHGSWRYLSQRFSFYGKQPRSVEYWFHCASVGETQLALPLIHAILKQHDGNVLITTNTPSANKLLQKQPNKNIRHVYLPLDYLFFINRFIKVLRPKQLFIIETELWPALFKACNKHNIDITLLNARFSNRTLHTNRFIKSLYKDCLDSCQAILCQSEKQLHNAKKLSINPHIVVAGNLKFHSSNDIDSSFTPINLTDRAYIALVSTHHDEEITLAKTILAKQPNSLLFIIPRHPERRQSLLRLFKEAGFSVAVRSREDVIHEDTQIYLADTIGEVKPLIYNATLCIIGGSFISHGGQNLLEPASMKKAIICGEDMSNFSDIVEEFIAQHALLVASYKDIADKTLALLQDDKARYQLAENAFNIYEKNKNITQHYLKQLNVV